MTTLHLKAFNLIELMVVIAIVGLLAAIAVPSYQNYLYRASMAQFYGLVDGALDKWESYDTTDAQVLTSNPTTGVEGPIASATYTTTGVQFLLSIYPSSLNEPGGGYSSTSALPFLFAPNTVVTYTADLSTIGSMSWTCDITFADTNTSYGGRLDSQQMRDDFFQNCTCDGSGTNTC